MSFSLPTLRHTSQRIKDERIRHLEQSLTGEDTRYRQRLLCHSRRTSPLHKSREPFPTQSNHKGLCTLLCAALQGFDFKHFCIAMKLSELIKQIATTDSFLQQRGILRKQAPACPTCNRDMTMVKATWTTDGVCFRCPSHKGQKSSIRSGSFCCITM